MKIKKKTRSSDFSELVILKFDTYANNKTEKKIVEYYVKVKSMQDHEPKQSEPKGSHQNQNGKKTKLPNSQNTKRKYGLPSELLFPNRWSLC